jgi:hypothetical protein
VPLPLKQISTVFCIWINVWILWPVISSDAEALKPCLALGERQEQSIIHLFFRNILKRK